MMRAERLWRAILILTQLSGSFFHFPNKIKQAMVSTESLFLFGQNGLLGWLVHYTGSQCQRTRRSRKEKKDTRLGIVLVSFSCPSCFLEPVATEFNLYGWTGSFVLLHCRLTAGAYTFSKTICIEGGFCDQSAVFVNRILAWKATFLLLHCFSASMIQISRHCVDICCNLWLLQSSVSFEDAVCTVKLRLHLYNVR